MAWHLHTVKHRLVLASLIRRNVYTSASLCCFLRGGCVSVYHCCLHHHNNIKPPCHHQQSANKHTNPQEFYANRSSVTQWPWDSTQILGSTNGNSQATRHDGKESSAKINTTEECSPSPDEYRTSLSHHHHTPRSQSLHWDRRETKLMCINHKCSYYVQKPDNGRHDLPTSCTGNTQTEIDTKNISNEQIKIDNTPLVFKLDSKGRQQMFDLLAVEKEGADQNAIDALNKFVDIILKKSTNKPTPCNQDSRDDLTQNTTPLQHHLRSRDDLTQSTTPWQHHLRETDYTYKAKIKTVPDWRTHRVAAYPNLNSQRVRVGGDHVAFCSAAGRDNPPVEETDNGDKPSKEQLTEMYHRLYIQIPNFYSQSHDYTMYADNLVFDNRILNVKTVGLPAYKATLQSLKYLSTACLWKVNLEVLNLTINTDMNCVQARWRVTGVPLHHLIFFPWRKSSKKYFDAFSSFDVGSDGLIHKHTVDRLMPNPGDKVPSLVTRIGMALGIIRPQSPSPAIQAGNVSLPWLKPRWRLKNNGIIP